MVLFIDIVEQIRPNGIARKSPVNIMLNCVHRVRGSIWNFPIFELKAAFSNYIPSGSSIGGSDKALLSCSLRYTVKCIEMMSVDI